MVSVQSVELDCEYTQARMDARISGASWSKIECLIVAMLTRSQVLSIPKVVCVKSWEMVSENLERTKGR